MRHELHFKIEKAGGEKVKRAEDYETET